MLLHGWPEFWYSCGSRYPYCRNGFQVIVPDMRGFGYSDKPASGYDTRTAGSDMYELARHLGHEQVAIVAHDIGVRVAFRFVLDHEEAVQRLAFLDSTPPIEQLGPQEPAVVRERWHSYFHQQFDLPEKLIEGREEVYLRHIFRDWTTTGTRPARRGGGVRAGPTPSPARCVEASATTARRHTRTRRTGAPTPTGNCLCRRFSCTAPGAPGRPRPRERADKRGLEQDIPQRPVKGLGQLRPLSAMGMPEAVNRELLAFLSE